MTTCSSCGVETIAWERFCHMCGNKLYAGLFMDCCRKWIPVTVARVCPSCGKFVGRTPEDEARARQVRERVEANARETEDARFKHVLNGVALRTEKGEGAPGYVAEVAASLLSAGGRAVIVADDEDLSPVYNCLAARGVRGETVPGTASDSLVLEASRRFEDGLFPVLMGSPRSLWQLRVSVVDYLLVSGCVEFTLHDDRDMKVLHRLLKDTSAGQKPGVVIEFPGGGHDSRIRTFQRLGAKVD